MDTMIIIAVLVAASVALIGYSLIPRRKSKREVVLERLEGKGQVRPESARPGIVKDAQGGSTVREMIERVAPVAMKPVMPTNAEEMSRLRERLAQAGFRRESTVRHFLASKTVIGLAVAVAALLFAWGGGYQTMHLFGIVVFCGGIGFMLPNFWLSVARGQRVGLVRDGLPDALDLLVVTVESGLGFDAALQRVADEMHHVHPALSEEMKIATLETQVGIPRAEALMSMARRCGVEEMSALVAVIVQAEKFGTSVAKTLRTQADALRIKRRLRAEERAQQTAVKLMIPLILCIFPSIFVVLLGPAVLQIMKAFKG